MSEKVQQTTKFFQKTFNNKGGDQKDDDDQAEDDDNSLGPLIGEHRQSLGRMFPSNWYYEKVDMQKTFAEQEKKFREEAEKANESVIAKDAFTEETIGEREDYIRKDREE